MAAAVRMAAEGGDGGGNEKRELDRLFEEMQRVNSRSSMGEAIKETVRDASKLGLVWCV